MTSTGSSSSIEPAEATAPATDTAHADLVIGILTYNDVSTIAGVAAAVQAGLPRGSDAGSSRILLADGGSTDGTVARARDALGPHGTELVEIAHPRLPGDLLDLPYHGLPGRARALRAVLTAARDLGAACCVVLDGGLQSVTPQWVSALSAPVGATGSEGGFDFASPFYLRHPFEGALTKSLVYPLFRALYGVRLRQPATGELGCSSRLLNAWLDDDLWDRDGAQIGVDIWLAAAAATGGFKICEVPLGLRAHHSRGEGGIGLETTIAQVVGSLFADMEAREDVWQRIRSSTSVPLIGDDVKMSLAPPDLNLERLIESFRLGYRELRDIWSWILPPRTIVELRKMASATPDRFHMDDELWAQIVYDFAVGYRLRTMPRDHLLRSLTPLYTGWLASIILQVRELPREVADARIERLAVGFEAQKPYLMSRWRWPERFRT
jgi:hypothetical protein